MMNQEEVDEQQLWENLTPLAWHNSVAEKDSIFFDTYHETRKQIREAAVLGDHDVIIEVGCGTGDIIGRLDDSSEIDRATRDGLADIDRFGLDINPDFLRFAKTNHNELNRCDFLVQDVTKMVPEWWVKNGYDKKYKKPLIVCVNNTLNIMPEFLRGATVQQMLAIAGDEGHCLVSYWNGNFFSHAIMNYYKRNPKLCGLFDIDRHVNWDIRKLVTSTGYSTTWHTVKEVQNILRAFDVDVELVHDSHKATYDHMNLAGLAIFAWFSTKCTSKAKAYYDSEDAQKFYAGIWSDSMTHIGRYDLLTDEDKKLTLHKQIFKAQERHEDEFVQLIKNKLGGEKVRILDMGCGYGGLLRLLWKQGLVWSAVGCDISHKMCQQARRLNEDLSTACDRDIKIVEESYLDVRVPDNSADLVISMDALLHVGPDGQRKAIKEAARILRPGGWMIFSDIMQQEVVQDPEEMQKIYDRIHLSKMGTVSNYRDAMEAVGFRKFEFLQASSTNVSQHYAAVRQVLEEIGDDLGISQEYQQNMKQGLQVWSDLATKNIVWGFAVAQKTVKVDLKNV